LQGYVEYVHNTPGLLSKADANTLFGNIEDVYRFHRLIIVHYLYFCFVIFIGSFYLKPPSE